ncbi:MAG: hypothetical protein H0Z35_11520 [Thermoanaerobacteraceae bacterium]|nr:hypothetical protein [Thermoanaerobacteraceae bacterium]
MKKFLILSLILSMYLLGGCSLLEGTPLEGLVLKINDKMSSSLAAEKNHTNFDIPDEPGEVVKKLFQAGWDGVEKNRELIEQLITDNFGDYNKRFQLFYPGNRENLQFNKYFVLDDVKKNGRTASVDFHNPSFGRYYTAVLVKTGGHYKIDRLKWRPNPNPKPDYHP